MERQLCLLLVLSSAVAKDFPTYFEVGGTLVLGPPAASPEASQSLTNILWKYNGNLVAEWATSMLDIDYYGNFTGRTNLNITTGYLQIKNMAKADNGMYSVEINNEVQTDRYDVKVIEKVPKPEVWVRPLTCNPSSVSCTLTCNGGIADAEPVTYSWKKGNEEWEEKSGKDINITKTEGSVKTFSCRMKNPISEEESEPQQNPLQVNPNGSADLTALYVIIAVVILIGGAVFGLRYFKRDVFRTIVNFIQRRGNNGPAPVNGQQPASGNRVQENTQETLLDGKQENQGSSRS